MTTDNYPFGVKALTGNAGSSLGYVNQTFYLPGETMHVTKLESCFD